MTSFHRRNHCLISLLHLVSEQEPISILVTQEGFGGLPGTNPSAVLRGGDKRHQCLPHPSRGGL